MKPRKKLYESMSPRQFDEGHWYVPELKAFAKSLGIPHTPKLRKGELETAIKTFMTTGTIKKPTERQLEMSGPKDIKRGLSLDLPVSYYTSDGVTKSFIHREAQRLAPGLKRQTGVLSSLNRWREEKLTTGAGITYRDLIEEYVRLNQSAASK